ncbi:hypothetical protein QE152_g4338 [Popillia japonica]|uniref:Uncharacterized protein n=1 Tax=Popillia japonica TaxID=7064 RepID=A0AAW1N1B6_POPJA
MTLSQTDCRCWRDENETTRVMQKSQDACGVLKRSTNGGVVVCPLLFAVLPHLFSWQLDIIRNSHIVYVYRKKHNVWLQKEICPESVYCDRSSTSSIRDRPSKSFAENVAKSVYCDRSSTSSIRDRPSKSFAENVAVIKGSKSEELRKSPSVEELL